MRNLHFLALQLSALLALTVFASAQSATKPKNAVQSVPLATLNGTWKALSPSPVAGRWVFAKSFVDKDNWRNNRYYLSIGQTSVDKAASPETHLQNVLKTNLEFLSPQWSPDGHHLLTREPLDFNLNMDYGYSSWWAIDLQANVFRGVEGSAYPIIRWSPSNRYVAYIADSRENGTPNRYSRTRTYSSPTLRVYDFQTRRSIMSVRWIETSFFQVPTFHWTSQNTLIFDTVDQVKGMDSEYEMGTPPTEIDLNACRIKEFDPSKPLKARFKLLLENAGWPQPSPDGEAILYRTLYENTGVRDTRTPRYLRLYREDQARKNKSKKGNVAFKQPEYGDGFRAGNGSYLLYRKSRIFQTLPPSPYSQQWLYPQRWLPDNRHLIAVSQKEDSKEGIISLYDVSSGIKHEIRLGQFVNKIYGLLEGSGFQLMSISSDSRFAIVKKVDFPHLNKSDFYETQAYVPQLGGNTPVVKPKEPYNKEDAKWQPTVTLIAVDLRDGASTPIVELQNPQGVDWIFDAPK